MQAIRTRWFNPYNENGKPSLKILNKKFSTGVYFIKSKRTGKIIYIGFSSSNLYKTIYRHFQTWNDSRDRIVYNKTGYQVRIIFTPPKRAAELERYLINKMQPADNVQKYSSMEAVVRSPHLMEDANNPIYVAPGEDLPF